MRRRRPPLRLLRVANPVVRLVLRSPAHRLLSSSLMLLTYTGRRSGRTFTIPVMYARLGETIVALAVAPDSKQWWQTFRTGARATLRIAGADTVARGRRLAEPEGRAALSAYLERFPRAARALDTEVSSPDEKLDAALAAVALVAFVPE